MHLRPLTLALLCAATLAGCGGDSGNTSIITGFGSSLANGGINLRHGTITLHVHGAPDAVIDAAGNLAIDGKPVTTDAAQHALLLDYYHHTQAVQQHGIDTGKAGAAIAGQALTSTVKGLVNGDTDNIDKEINARAAKVEQAAMRICDDMAGIQVAQNALAASLAAFKPYGDIIQDSSVKDCRDSSD